MVIKKYVKHLFGIAFAIFISNKFFLRPWVIEHDLPELFQIVVFSIPNLIEAILGTLVLTGILLQLRQKLNKLENTKETTVYMIASCIAALYVISQELKFHNLGGNNIYDPYDLGASIIGLLLTSMVINKFGFTDY